MKAKRGWIRYDIDYSEWYFSNTIPDNNYYTWTEIIYFEVEDETN